MNVHQTTQKCKLAQDKIKAHKEYIEMIEEEERILDEEFDEYLERSNNPYLERKIFGNL
jgi:hypothetical protein